MARRRLSAAERARIEELRAAGYDDGSIAELTGRDRKTVAKVLAKRFVAGRPTASRRELAKCQAQGRAQFRRSLCPPAITAKPNSAAWWAQCEKSFRAGYAVGRLEEIVARETHPSTGEIVAKSQIDSPRVRNNGGTRSKP